MVSTFAKARDSLRETLSLLHVPQRRSTAPAMPSAETVQPCSMPTNNSPRVAVRAVRPNHSLNLRANGVPQSPRHSAGVHYLWRGLCVTPLSPG